MMLMTPRQKMKLMHELKTLDRAEQEYGVMIGGLCSRSKSAVPGLIFLTKQLATLFLDWPVKYRYLEFATPVITAGFTKLRVQVG